jgi:hypothetical protein
MITALFTIYNIAGMLFIVEPSPPYEQKKDGSKFLIRLETLCHKGFNKMDAFLKLLV